jgi:hypothetical protein
VSISFVQHNSDETNPANPTATCTYTGAQTLGNLNVVIFDGLTGGGTPTSVTDTTGNTYHLACTTTASNSGGTGGATFNGYIYYAWNIGAASAGANTVTVTFTGSTSGVFIVLLEYSGAMNTANPLDTTGTTTSDVAGVGSSGTASLTTSVANELVVLASVNNPGQYSSVSAGFTNRDSAQAYVTGSDGDFATAGSVTGTVDFTSNSVYTILMAAFLPPQTGSPFGGCAYDC